MGLWYATARFWPSCDFPDGFHPVSQSYPKGPVVQEPSIRCTVIDPGGTVTFVGPGHLSKILAAACAKTPADTRTLFQLAEQYDGSLVQDLSAGLAIFDEHNVGEDHSWIDERLGDQSDYPLPVRVVNAMTRELSLSAFDAGLIVFNLNARRIVQVQNSYADILRRDRGRIREAGEPTDRIFRYDLPDAWTILP